jgi:hypothetical protein
MRRHPDGLRRCELITHMALILTALETRTISRILTYTQTYAIRPNVFQFLPQTLFQGEDGQVRWDDLPCRSRYKTSRFVTSHKHAAILSLTRTASVFDDPFNPYNPFYAYNRI